MFIDELINKEIRAKGNLIKKIEIDPYECMEAYEELLCSMPEKTIGKDYMATNPTADYLNVNVFKTTSDTYKNYIFGETPIFSIKCLDKEKRDMLAAKLSTLIERNNLHTKNQQQALYQSSLGACVYKLSFRKRNKYSKKPEVIIEAVHPSRLFVILDSQDQTIVDHYEVRSRVKFGSKTYLKIEKYYIGVVENEIWAMHNDQCTQMMDWNAFYPEVAVRTEIEQIDTFMIFYIPNDIQLPTLFYGISDYNDIVTLGREINKRYSMNGKILDTDQDPKWLVPEEFVDENGYMKNTKVFTVGAGIRRDDFGALSTETKIEDSEKHLNLLINSLCMITGIDRATYGFDDRANGQALSERAMRSMKQTLLKRVQAKRNNFNIEKDMLKTAIILELLAENKPIPDFSVDIKWYDGIPVDTSEEIDYQIKMLDAGLTTLKKAIKEIHDIDDEQAEILIKEILEEKRKKLEENLKTD